MPRQYRVHDLRDDGVVEAHDAGKHRSVAPQPNDEVIAQLVLDATRTNARFRKLRMTTKLSKRAG